MSNVVNLKKGDKVNLSKMDSGLNKVIVGLGWDSVDESKLGFLAKILGVKEDIDCDVFAIELNQDGRLGSSTTSKVVYFGRLMNDNGSIKHSGDNLTGAGKSMTDKEQLVIELKEIISSTKQILIGVNIYNGVSRRQSFKDVKNSFIRIVNAANGTEMCRYNLQIEGSGYVTFIFGALIQDSNNQWSFEAIGQASKATSIPEVAREYA